MMRRQSPDAARDVAKTSMRKLSFSVNVQEIFLDTRILILLDFWMNPLLRFGGCIASTEAECQWNCSAHRPGRVTDCCPTMKGVAKSMYKSRLSPPFRVSAKDEVTRRFSSPDVHRIYPMWKKGKFHS